MGGIFDDTLIVCLGRPTADYVDTPTIKGMAWQDHVSFI
jgi:hypothetical protein